MRHSIAVLCDELKAAFGTDLVCAAVQQRQNNELRMVAMTMCLCHGGVCELSIRCSWPPCNPPPPLWGTVTWPKKYRKHQAPKAPKKNFLWIKLELGLGGTVVW